LVRNGASKGKTIKLSKILGENNSVNYNAKKLLFWFIVDNKEKLNSVYKELRCEDNELQYITEDLLPEYLNGVR